jgi:GAF domain
MARGGSVVASDLRPLRAWRGSSSVIARTFEQAVRTQLADHLTGDLTLRQLCEACVEVTSLPVSIVLATDGHLQAAMAASRGADAVEEAQFKLGEGPGVDAYTGGRPVLVGDFAQELSRWIHFVPAAQAFGIYGAFAYPLQLGVIRLGVLSIYTDRVRAIGDRQLRDQLELSELVTDAVLAMQAGMPADQLGWALASAAEHRAVAQQAIGAVAMQLECSAQDALARLRARAFADGVGLDVVARQVIERRIHFER